METESVKSGFSDHSLRLKPHSKHTSRSNSHRNAYSHNRSMNRFVSFHLCYFYTYFKLSLMFNSGCRSLRSARNDDIMSPYQTAVTLEDGRNGQEVIEVQILPQVRQSDFIFFENGPTSVLSCKSFLQDENWGENTTAVTGNTSEQSGSVEDIALWSGSESDSGFKFFCHKHITSVVTVMLSLVAFLSPLVMLILPKIG